MLGTLITDAITAHRDDDAWSESTDRMEDQRRLLRATNLAPTAAPVAPSIQ